MDRNWFDFLWCWKYYSKIFVFFFIIKRWWKVLINVWVSENFVIYIFGIIINVFYEDVL